MSSTMRRRAHMHSRSPSPPSQSHTRTPSVSSSSPSYVDRVLDSDDGESQVEGAVPLPEADAVRCRWGDDANGGGGECGLSFDHLPTLIAHVHNDHIGMHKSNYTCNWGGCLRRGLPQTSRFALISHIRSHTGEKPFVCPRPECDKSFTRSDALAKHMRLLHNISPPAPGRGGGNRKRKRNPLVSMSVSVSAVDSSAELETSHLTSTPFNKFKVEPQSPDEYIALDGPLGNGTRGHFTNGHCAGKFSPPTGRHFSAEEADAEEEDALPAHLLAVQDTRTGLIMGRSPAMIRYILMKRKHAYAIEQREQLMEELTIARADLRREKEHKESALDDLLRSTFGDEAEALIVPIQPEIYGTKHQYHPSDM